MYNSNEKLWRPRANLMMEKPDCEDFFFIFMKLPLLLNGKSYIRECDQNEVQKSRPMYLRVLSLNQDYYCEIGPTMVHYSMDK